MNKFKSELSQDEVCLIILQKSHKAIFDLKSIDSATEHIKLISTIEKFLKKEDIKWIEFSASISNPVIPINSICYTNPHNNNVNCHIEDFLKFYMSNISQFVKLSHIKNKNKDKPDPSKWITVKAPQKVKKEKYDLIIEELKLLGKDWTL